MARYPASSNLQGKGINKGIIFIVLAVIVAGAAAFFLLRKDKEQTPTAAETDEIFAAMEKELMAVAAEQNSAQPTPTFTMELTEPNAAVVAIAPAPAPNVNMPVVEVNAAQPPIQTIVNTGPQAAALIAEASALMNSPQSIAEARSKFNDALLMPLSNEQRTLVKGKLSQLSQQWLFDRNVLPHDSLCTSYRVQPGDLLSTIGDKFKVPYELLMEINGIIRPESLQAGQTIKVVNGPFHARVYRSTFTLDLYLQNTYVRSFTVGLGKPGMETPTGLWIVKPGGKLIKPRWTDPVSGKTYAPEDPDYPLGSRWIALEGLKGNAVGRTGFAIHGTKEPQEIGSATSQGCIRLHNGDVVLMYNVLMTGFSQVEVLD